MLNVKKFARILYRSIEESPADPESAAKTFVSEARKGNYMHLLPSVLKHLKSRAEKEKEDRTMIIRVAREVSLEIIQHIRAYVTGDPTVPHRIEIDPDLIGGFSVRYRGKTYDGSVRSNLQRLQNFLEHESGNIY